jgi:hypothetical protein
MLDAILIIGLYRFMCGLCTGRISRSGTVLLSTAAMGYLYAIALL